MSDPSELRTKDGGYLRVTWKPIAGRPVSRSEIIEALGIDYAAARRTFDELYYGNPTELGLVLDNTIAAALGLGDDE